MIGGTNRGSGRNAPANIYTLKEPAFLWCSANRIDEEWRFEVCYREHAAATQRFFARERFAGFEIEGSYTNLVQSFGKPCARNQFVDGCSLNNNVLQVKCLRNIIDVHCVRCPWLQGYGVRRLKIGFRNCTYAIITNDRDLQVEVNLRFIDGHMGKRDHDLVRSVHVVRNRRGVWWGYHYVNRYWTWLSKTCH